MVSSTHMHCLGDLWRLPAGTLECRTLEWQVRREGGVEREAEEEMGGHLRFLFPPPRSRLLLVEGKCFWIRDRKTPLQGREGSAHGPAMALQFQGDEQQDTVAPRLGSLGRISRKEPRWGKLR